MGKNYRAPEAKISEDVVVEVPANEPIPTFEETIVEEVVTPVVNDFKPAREIQPSLLNTGVKVNNNVNKETSVEITDIHKYPDYTFYYEVTGFDGSWITQYEKSPNGKVLLSLVEVYNIAKKGYTLRWKRSDFKSSIWFNAPINKDNVGLFAFFIDSQLKRGVLNKLDLSKSEYYK